VGVLDGEELGREVTVEMTVAMDIWTDVGVTEVKTTCCLLSKESLVKFNTGFRL
jgi:hypothetical protein